MTREEIKRLAREAEIPVGITGGNPTWEKIERFVSLVVAAERKECAAEIEALRNANEAFARRQEWWNDRMVALEAAVLAEREACAAIAYLGDTTDAIYKCIRARGKNV